MPGFGDIDWAKLFLPDTPILEIIVRGTVLYLGLFVMLRVVLKRQSGTLGITDLLIIVLLADAAQNAMAGGYQSITNGLILVATLIFWAYLLDWLGYRFPRFQRLVHPPPLLLVDDGRMIEANMRKELVTDRELRSMLREQGVEDIQEVEKAFMEGNGKISVITRDRRRHEEQEREI